MIRMEEWVDIVAAHRRGVSIKEIVRRTGLSRNTVRSAIRKEGVPKYSRPEIPSKLDPYKDYLLRRLEEYPRITVEKLLAEIKVQGYDGGRTILSDFTRPYRMERRKTSDIRFETPPGHQAQVDWAELGYHMIGGKRFRISLFVMILCYSRMLYARVVTDEKSETFLACHTHAFEYFGGVTDEILYDNAKVVALKRDREGIVFNEALLDFAGLNGFVPRVCRPYRPQTKGKVERAVRYIRDSFLEGESFSGLEDMQNSLLAWLDGTANQRIHATTKRRPVELLMDEDLRDFRSPSSDKLTSPIILNVHEEKHFSFTDAPVIPVRPLTVYEEAAL